MRQALAEQLRAEETLEATRRDLGLRLHNEYRGVTEGAMKVKALEQAVASPIRCSHPAAAPSRPAAAPGWMCSIPSSSCRLRGAISRRRATYLIARQKCLQALAGWRQGSFDGRGQRRLALP